MGFSAWQIVFIILWIGPVFHVLASSRSHGGAKFGWLLAVCIFWLVGYAVFLIFTQKNVDQVRAS